MKIRLWRRGPVSNPGVLHPGRLYGAFVGSACAALVAFFTYEWMLECSFTGTDVFALIESSRIKGFQDIIRAFSGPLMQGTEFTSVALFYRPLATLSYGLDFRLWGLEPFGFQLTNLFLHVLVSLAVFALMRRLSRGDGLFAATAAMLFAVHPILVESVPAIDRRHDLIAALFFAISLWCYLAAASQESANRRSGLFLALSVLAYVCALGGKEIAIILPGVVWAHAMLLRIGGPLRGRVKATARLIAPYLVTSFLYLAWRIYVLGELVGGYVTSDHEPPSFLWYVVNTVHCYVQDLVYPVDFGGFLDGEFSYVPTAVLVGAAATYVLFYFLGRGRGGRVRTTSDFGRLALFLLVWLLLPLALFVLTYTFSHRSMYLPVIPMAGLVAGSAIESIRLMRAHMGSWQSMETGLTVSCRCGVIAAAGVLCLSLVAYSPLFNTYGQWKESARISTMFLERLAALVQRLPRNCSIHVHGLPEGVKELNEQVPHAKEVTYIRDYAIKSWLNLRFPQNAIRIFVHKRSWPQSVEEPLRLSMLEIGHNSCHVFVDVSRQRHAFVRANGVRVARPFRVNSISR